MSDTNSHKKPMTLDSILEISISDILDVAEVQGLARSLKGGDLPDLPQVVLRPEMRASVKKRIRERIIDYLMNAHS